jgi:transketolase
MGETATRDAFGKALVEAGRQHDNVVVFGLDLKGATKTDGFLKEFPERFFEMGIAEANGISTSAGMALYGFRPFISSFGAFITGRYDMIRQSIAGNRAGVVIVGSHAGLAIGKDGATQMGLEDIALMRAIPHMTVIQPADDLETKQVVEFLAKTSDPCYLRICRQPVPRVHGETYQFQFGTGTILSEGEDLTIFATGGTVHTSLSAARLLVSEGISARVVNLSTLKPIDKVLILRCANETPALLSVEDHSVIGGMGSAIADVLAQYSGTRLLSYRIHGIPDVFGESGDPKDLYRKYLLDEEGIAQVATKLLRGTRE